MYGKHVLVIACSGFLLAGMGSALAVEDATAADQQNYSNEQAADTSPTTPSQTVTDANNDAYSDSNNKQDSTPGAEQTWQSEQTSQEDTTTGQSGPSDTTVDTAKSTQGHIGDAGDADAMPAGIGRVVGKVVSESGHVRGYVIRTGDSKTGGANRYVIVPPENVRAVTEASTSEMHSTTGTGAAGASTQSVDAGQRQRLLKRMYQLLQKQAVEIRLLRTQIAEQQHGMSSSPSLAANTKAGPLDQVAHVVVDRLGRVQAVVLDSGAILASDEWAHTAQGMTHSGAQSATTAGAIDNTQGTAKTGERRRAIIILQPEQ